MKSTTHVTRKEIKRAPEGQNMTPEASIESAFESTKVLGDPKSIILPNIDNKSNAIYCNVSLAQAGGENFGYLNPIDPHETKLMEKGRNTPLRNTAEEKAAKEMGSVKSLALRVSETAITRRLYQELKVRKIGTYPCIVKFSFIR